MGVFIQTDVQQSTKLKIKWLNCLKVFGLIYLYLFIKGLSHMSTCELTYQVWIWNDWLTWVCVWSHSLLYELTDSSIALWNVWLTWETSSSSPLSNILYRASAARAIWSRLLFIPTIIALRHSTWAMLLVHICNTAYSIKQAELQICLLMLCVSICLRTSC